MRSLCSVGTSPARHSRSKYSSKSVVRNSHIVVATEISLPVGVFACKVPSASPRLYVCVSAMLSTRIAGVGCEGGKEKKID